MKIEIRIDPNPKYPKNYSIGKQFFGKHPNRRMRKSYHIRIWKWLISYYGVSKLALKEKI